MNHVLIHYLTSRLRERTTRLRTRLRDDAGYSTETVIVTALLVVLAIAVVGIIAAKVTDKASSINF